MKSFTFATLSALVTAGRVHDFFAENNYICEVCKMAVDFANSEDSAGLESLYKMHPELQNRINAFYGHKEVLDLNSPEKTCQNMDLCSTESIFELLMAEQPLDLSDHIEHVNSNPHSNWVAGVNNKFEGASLKEIKNIMGTVVDPLWTIQGKVKNSNLNTDLPENFDARTQWPECESVINHVRDQSNCGSCWAHGTTEALNDRICISQGGDFTTLLSVSDTTGCCNGIHCASFGCNGGQVGTPWEWFKSTGVVTGGDYGDNGTCYDYTMAKCAHHVDDPSLPSCDDITQVEPTCGKTCPDDGSRTYSDDKHFGTSSYGFGFIGAVDKIKQDIYSYGTVTAAFTVYEDFLTYKSGVYSHQTGSALGGHAIKVIGWGTEGGDDYWLAVNSWNNTWGDLGTFKIKQGDCGIDNQMHAGLAGI